MMTTHMNDCEGTTFPDVVRVASAPGEARLVVINLRGAMDGLDAVQPYGDPMLRALRGDALSVGPEGGAIDLDGFFALHPALGPIMPLWQAGELAFVHAVSTPYRDHRSHFDGQDLLEMGSERSDHPDLVGRTGFLNRLVGCIPNARMQLAWAVGLTRPLMAHGPAPFGAWSPALTAGLTQPDIALMRRIYEQDGSLLQALEDAAATAQSLPGLANVKSDAAFVAKQLAGEGRIATFSIEGWDTHAGQAATIAQRFKLLTQAILTLKAQLGKAWTQTVVVAVTEFGRAARVNGSGGTDHGTGGLAVLAGGAVKGGKVYGRWPGLSDLYADRDLMPTADVRDYLASICHAHLGVEAALVTQVVFPGTTIAPAVAGA